MDHLLLLWSGPRDGSNKL